MSCIKYVYTIIALFQPSQAKEQRVAREILTIPPSQLSICSSVNCVYTFPDRRCAESALSVMCIAGEAPLLEHEASSNPITHIQLLVLAQKKSTANNCRKMPDSPLLIAMSIRKRC